MKKSEEKTDFTELLKKYGIDERDILFSAKIDMKNAVQYTDARLALTRDKIIYISADGTFNTYITNNVREIKTERFPCSGRIILEYENEERILCCFSAKCAREADAFAANVEKQLAAAENDTSYDYAALDDEYKNPGRKKLFLRLLSYVPKYGKSLGVMIATILLATAINVLQPYISGTVLYDEVLNAEGKYYGKILLLVTYLVILSAVTVCLGIVRGRIGADMSGRIVYDIKTEVFSAMQKLGMSFFSSKRTGNLLNRINADALDIQYFLNDGLPNFIINGLTISAVGLVLFIKNPILSVTVLVPVPIMALIIKKSGRNFKKLKWHTWRRSSELNSVINDTLLGIRVVKAFGREKNETERFGTAANNLYENCLREGYARARVFPFLSWIMAMGGVFVWAMGGVEVMHGKLSFGELMTFVGYLSMLYNPVNSMVHVFDWWSACMNSAQRIFEVTDARCEITESENPQELKNMRGEVEFKNVTFSYEPNRKILKNVSFAAKSGEMTGLVGHSGAGKSTITNLITRLYDVQEGEVLIDGINVKDIRLEDLRGNIGIVLQDTFLFSGTVAENISYAKPEATREEIIAAAKKAYAHEFIINLRDGYETMLCKDGVMLSGGERQRIGIARAILMNPKILILDEATASLDTQTEKKIQLAMETLTKGRTTIAIAHRLSTLKNADRLVVVRNGCVAESGTHTELMKKENGVYANMANRQLEALRMNEA